MFMKIFAERLKELRVEKGLSTIELGKAIGISDATISRWENNLREPIFENVVRVAKFFGVSTDYLAGLEN